MWAIFAIECLCGASNRQLKSRRLRDLSIPLTICHCHTCRRTSGALCMAYYPVQKPDRMKGLRKYEGDDEYCRFFCVVCGCHMFRWRADTGWEAATGVMQGRVDEEEREVVGRFVRHERICDTRDGGISRWLLNIGGRDPECDYSMAPMSEMEARGVDPLELDPSHGAAQETIGEETLLASCDCGTVKFYITRPDGESSTPSAPYSDLMVPNVDSGLLTPYNYHASGKWGAIGKRYRASVCACRSCRLTSGFEVHPWVHIPQRAIHFALPQDNETLILPLDLDAIPQSVLNQTFHSSPNVTRSFCNVCGASVFSRNGERPDVLGVSVGLLRAAGGARAGRWLAWWKGRVGFGGEVGRERWGDEGERARGLVESLEENMGLDWEDNVGFDYGDDDPF